MRTLSLQAMAVLVITTLLLTASPTQAVHVEGPGQLTAWGTGFARVDGSGTIYMRGSGTLVVLDFGENADVEIHGFDFSRRLQNGATAYRGAGWILVKGPTARVSLSGGVEMLRVHGKGTCDLKGTGRYKVRHKTNPWRQVGGRIHYDLRG